MLENIEVEPARPKARVVVNARTGTIVIGGDVRVTPAAVSHGSLTVKVNEDTNTVPGQTLFDDAGNITQQSLFKNSSVFVFIMSRSSFAL